MIWYDIEINNVLAKTDTASMLVYYNFINCWTIQHNTLWQMIYSWKLINKMSV